MTIYSDYYGRKPIGIPNLCSSNLPSAGCRWLGNPAALSLREMRWYSPAELEALGNDTIILIGGFAFSGYVSSNMSNVNPAYEGGAQPPSTSFILRGVLSLSHNSQQPPQVSTSPIVY